MYDSEYSPEELVHTGDLNEVPLAELEHLQDVQTKEVGSGRGTQVRSKHTTGGFGSYPGR